MCATLKSLLSVYSAPRERKCACVLSGLPLHFLLFFLFSLKYRENERGGGDLSVWKVGFWSEIVFASQMILATLFSSCVFFLFFYTFIEAIFCTLFTRNHLDSS